MIHPTAIVHPGAKLGANVSVGAYSLIGEHVEIGEGTRIGAALSAPLPKDGARLVRGLRWQMAAPVAQ